MSNKYLGREDHAALDVARASGSYLFNERGRRYIDEIQRACPEEGLVVTTQGSRVLPLPPLVIERNVAARGLDILTRWAKKLR